VESLVPDFIIGCLKREPMWSVADLARELSVSESCIRKNIKALMADGKAHFVETGRPGTGGSAQFWNLGPFPPNHKLSPRGRKAVATAVLKDSDADNIDTCPPKHITVKEWPSEPVVDPLLWALHKPVTEAV
jgi:hypothetical protein